MCPGGDSNSHGFPPPPQDGASANFATRTIRVNLFYSFTPASAIPIAIGTPPGQ